MAQNITLLGANYADVPSVVLPKTGGGTAQFDDTTDATATAADIITGKTAYVNGQKLTGTNSGGGGSFDWKGQGAYLMASYTTEKTLSETDFVGWTPSTTQKTILAAQTLSSDLAINLTDYDYIFVERFDSKTEYSSTPSSAHSLRFIARYVSFLSRTFNGSSATVVATSFARDYNRVQLFTNLYNLKYKTAQGVERVAVNNQYGASYVTGYPGVTVASTSAASTTVTLKTPNVYARANNTYSTTASLGAVNQSASKFKIIIDVYRVDKDTSNFGVLNSDIMDLYNNPII